MRGRAIMQIKMPSETTISEHMSEILKWALCAFLLGAPIGLAHNFRPNVAGGSEVHAPFPEIHDWNSLRITLSRSGCYGMCSTYEIEIHGDGSVLYDGQAYVGTTGKQKVQISHASLVKLVDAFRKVDYFSLAAGYASGVTDMPTYVTSIAFDGVSKSLLDYVGREAGMPPGVSDVEAAIDQLSGASNWVRRK